MSADLLTQRFLLDRIIHESSAHLKPDRPGAMLSSQTQVSCVLGGVFLFCTSVT